MTNNDKRLGNIRGAGLILWKITEVVMPIMLAVIMSVMTLVLLPWTKWVTSELYGIREFRMQGSRFTKEDGVALELRMTNMLTLAVEALNNTIKKVDDRVDSMPPDDWRVKIESTSEVTLDNKMRLIRIESQLEQLLEDHKKDNP